MNSQIRALIQLTKKSFPVILPQAAASNVAVNGGSRMMHVYCGKPLLEAASSVSSTKGRRGVQTQADKELSEFLVKEIEAEKKARRSPKLPKIEGFEVTANGAEIVLSKKLGDEVIKVTLDVNHSVDSEDSSDEADQSPNKAEEMTEMKSKPNFTVEIVKEGKTMSVQCIFNTDMEEGEASDAFQITELSIFEGEWKDTHYSVSGEIMDGFLYDLLMNMLDERGVSNEFADQLIQYCTSYEHGLYINLLEKLKNFVSQ